MEKLNNKSDCNKYLKNGFLTQPFLEKDLIIEKVMLDYNAKKEKNNEITIIESLYTWIGRNVKFQKENEGLKNLKFHRTAHEVWESKLATGCTDYAIVFATLARQLGIPTTILHTAEYNWVKRLKKGGDIKKHLGHSFCECFYNGQWILVDPTARKIQLEYNLNIISLNYLVGESSQFVPYLRGLDLGLKQSIEEHNLFMEKEYLKCVLS